MNVLILEDEVAASRRLVQMLQTLRDDIRIVGVLESVESAAQWFQMHPAPDLILLDVHLADGDAFDFLQLVQVASPIVFITAYDEYAIKAFRVHAVDYLLKPLKRSELELALNRVSGQQDKVANYQSLVAGHARPRRFLVHSGSRMVLVDQQDAAYFYTEHKNLFIVTLAGKRYLINDSLEHLEETLPSADFFRINRQYIIHLKSIRDMFPESRSRVRVVLNPPAEEDLIVSTDRSPRFKQWLLGL